MNRLTLLFRLGSPFAILLFGSFVQGCCGIGSGPSVPEVRQWVSVIQNGDPADKAVAVLKSKGFKVFDSRLTPEDVQRLREQGRVIERRENYIHGVRVTDRCIFTLLEKHVDVEIELDPNGRVIDVRVLEMAEGP